MRSARRATVSNSDIVIMKPPSPTISTVTASGRAAATPSAVPNPAPMDAKSLVKRIRSGPDTGM